MIEHQTEMFPIERKQYISQDGSFTLVGVDLGSDRDCSIRTTIKVSIVNGQRIFTITNIERLD